MFPQSTNGCLFFANQPEVGRHSGPVTGHLVSQGESQRAFVKGCLSECQSQTFSQPLSYLLQPHSYTGEDMCEFHVHGSVAIVSSLLDCIGSLSGVRPAEAGEFTRRAFLNDKLNLIQAEAVGALIDSRTDSQRRHALNELSESNISSTTTAKYQRWADQMLLFVAYMEAYIEFGEDQLLNEQKIEMELDKLRSLRQEIRSYLHTASRTGDLIRHGVNVTILGQPNVGKSSLINKLCKQIKKDFEIFYFKKFKMTISIDKR